MYHVLIRNQDGIIAEALREGLAEAVQYGKNSGQKGNRIIVYDAVQDATGAILHLDKVVSTVILEGIT